MVDLRRAERPVIVRVFVPPRPGARWQQGATRHLAIPFEEIILENIPDFVPHQVIQGDHGPVLVGDTPDGRQALALLALTRAAEADGIMTDGAALIGLRYPLLQHHRIRVIPLSELTDWVEVCAHGHSLFWSASYPYKGLGVDLFYQWTHWKNRRLAEWFFRIQARITNEVLTENLRSLMLNRYPFILYSRDMVRFYELQMDHFARKGFPRTFTTPLGYYLTSFYLYLWGVLEQLTIIANHVRGLELRDRDCGIRRETFWEEFGRREPALWRFMESPKVSEWVGAMADVRHAAAHRSMLLPSALVQETEESRRNDDEIREILKSEDPEFYEVMSGEMQRALEPQRISLWRMDHMETIGENVVVVRREVGGYIRFAVDSVDYDLTMLNAIMDAFLVTLFRRE